MMYYSLYIGTMKVNMFLESHNDLTTLGQRTANHIRDEISQSRLLFQEDTMGLSYVSRLSTPADRPVMSGSVLPVIDPTGALIPDNGSRRVGNSLLLAREELPETFSVDHDGDAMTPPVDLLADLYRFEYVYLSENTERNFNGLGYYLDLVEAKSDPYADYFQLTGLTSAVRSQVASGLIAMGVTFAWDPGQTADQAFYRIQGDGTLSGPLSHSIALPETDSLMPQFRGGRVEGSMNYSVGVQTDPPLKISEKLGLFAQSSGNFPGGFESLIVGPAASRKTLIRIVLVAEYSNKLNASANSVISNTSEF